ncbi:MAG: UDP-N-acetylmuramoyl-tripeptide--D-alanyl-D-alanine ligase [Thermoleophilia bacterium]|jgi:UDP-N-acetylmuramoyl-tripeptide--D-alanyl-D-alanine ligase|nr:UDP-N-acetylmuramoyl-tripeptide--D-alanyl-D-alanine ligase [Thermoleophilia bacterium]
MLPLTLGEVAAAVGGELRGADGALTVRGVSTDTRRLRPGDLFVALRGERFDGDEFAARALAAGAAAVLVRRETAVALGDGRPCVAVDDGVPALGALARAVRRGAGIKVVGITGSAGKTSTKDILAALLRPVARVVATHGNLNNEVGLPLTLLEVERSTEVAVVEMAMRGPGQIRELAAIAEPDVAVITNVAPVHLELVGGIEDVAAAKAEILEGLGPGTAVVPGDEPLLEGHLRRHEGRVVTFGTPQSDVHLVESEARGTGTHVLVDSFGRRGTVDFNFGGEHYLRDAQAALAAFLELGYRLDEARPGAAAVTFSELRGEIVALRGGGLLLDDSYNANPAATEAALDHLVALAAGRPAIALLGDMRELGPDAPAYHRAVGEYAARAGVQVVAAGELARHYLCGAPHEAWFPTVEELIRALPGALAPGSAVLVKASRALAFERVAAAVKEAHPPAANAGEAGAAPAADEEPGVPRSEGAAAAAAGDGPAPGTRPAGPPETTRGVD